MFNVNPFHTVILIHNRLEQPDVHGVHCCIVEILKPDVMSEWKGF